MLLLLDMLLMLTMLLVLTMFHHQVLEQKARALGTSDFITKDVAPKALCERLVAAVHPPAYSAAQAAGSTDPIAFRITSVRPNEATATVTPPSSKPESSSRPFSGRLVVVQD